ncbi:MAG: peptidylprolyl isomerase [Candidatus Doudnabacteria bacterium]|nr:peptidylprolyl isomerase [Candidatus Doudnabacteria bacterium]
MTKGGYWQKLIFSIALLAAILAAFFFWLAQASSSPAKQAILRNLSVPIVLVEGQPIYSTELYKRLGIAKSLMKKDEPYSDKAEKQIYDRLVYETKLKLLAHKKNSRLDDWTEFTSPLPGNKNKIFEDALRIQGYEDSIKFWFYSQRDLNSDAYALAEQIILRHNRGKTFGELAKLYSQDITSLQFQGDLGPISANNLMLELKEPLIRVKSGETVILPSRIGIHVIEPYYKRTSEKGEDVIYLKQIYLKGSKFEDWVARETKDYKITRLIKI